jgi:uncharacterized protein (DUF2164 family)
MAIALTADERKQSVASLARYCRTELEVDVSDIQALALVEFFLKEIGPSVYNKAVADAQAFLRDRLADLEATCYEPEFTFWPKGSSVRRK